MDAGVIRISLCILLCIFISDPSTAATPPIERIHRSQKLTNEETDDFFSSPIYDTELDTAPGTIPIVNPTTPTTTTPIIGSPPPPPMFGGPMTNPTPVTNPPATSGGGGGGGSWCVANPNASPASLQVALDYACGYGGADCSAIQPGSSCYDPNTVKDHASYAFNDYYQKNPVPTSCVFGGAAQLTSTDPSYGNCHFASSNRNPMTPTTTTPMTPSPTIPVTTPSTTTPMNPYSPGGPTGYGSEPTDYGSEPTGTPSSAETMSYNLQWLLVMTCLTLWVFTANYF
ncbi:OLC1v1022101C1 [Oldenlandia corymbosa var. corymbosa]|uniref:OLC1v1022101C1 n=1 Tax=Oldenlandia corymbosa var. corymbosa TaxID=529605 RepID=A0AAV1BYU6_OLDCO|nr:OLC1v1022101C1 [Oldenlandia corymbosa var. corymbosa]